jgi:mannose-6-phosphate isomerase-like protein (cupin superfamily)
MKVMSHRTLSLLGVSITFLASAEDTGGHWSLLEYTAPPQFKGPAPHWHKRTTEAFYIVEGQLSMQIGERIIEAQMGSFVLVAPREIHVWSNPQITPCKFLVFVSPSGLEGYFDEVATLMQDEVTWPPADMSKVVALAEKFDTFSPPVCL